MLITETLIKLHQDILNKTSKPVIRRKILRAAKWIKDILFEENKDKEWNRCLIGNNASEKTVQSHFKGLK